MKEIEWMDGCLQFYVLFNSISVISGPCLDDNERLCVMESRLLLERFPPQVGTEPGTARSVGQRLTHRATRAPERNCTGEYSSHAKHNHEFMYQETECCTIIYYSEVF